MEGGRQPPQKGQKDEDEEEETHDSSLPSSKRRRGMKEKEVPPTSGSVTPSRNFSPRQQLLAPSDPGTEATALYSSLYAFSTYLGGPSDNNNNNNNNNPIPSPVGQITSPSLNPPKNSPTERLRTGTHSGQLPFALPLFILQEQPNKRQKKVMKKEIKYIVPNPLVIVMREANRAEVLPKIVKGTVTAQLANKDGAVLSHMEPVISELDENNQARFSLRIPEISEGTMFRVHFTVDFMVENYGRFTDIILSRSFIIYSNRKKFIQAPPILIALRPEEGRVDEVIEVWIKGRDFAETAEVLFGDRVAEVVEQTERFLAAKVPQRLDIREPTTVPVTARNRYPTGGVFTAEESLAFKYLPADPQAPAPQRISNVPAGSEIGRSK